MIYEKNKSCEFREIRYVICKKNSFMLICEIHYTRYENLFAIILRHSVVGMCECGVATE